MHLLKRHYPGHCLDYEPLIIAKLLSSMADTKDKIGVTRVQKHRIKPHINGETSLNHKNANKLNEEGMKEHKM